MSAQVEQMSGQSQELASTAEQLKELVARFQLDDSSAHPTTGARRQAATRATLRRVA
jgi:hypothetical protein